MAWRLGHAVYDIVPSLTPRLRALQIQRGSELLFRQD